VGVNKHVAEDEKPIDILKISGEVEHDQKARLAAIKESATTAPCPALWTPSRPARRAGTTSCP
jgi:methylmalonyl-CoA mutase N-terminal domain/subunit